MTNHHKEDLNKSNLLFGTKKNDREKFKLPKRIISFVFYSGALILLIYLIFFSSIFTIKKVEVENAKSIEIEDYIKISLLGKNNLLLTTGKFLDELIDKHPVIEEASISRGLPDRVRVALKERNYEFLWCNATKCYEVDNRGYIIDETAKSEGMVPLRDLRNVPVKNNEKVVSAKFVSFFINSLERFHQLNLSVKEARLNETTFKIEFETNEGWLVILDSSSSIENQFSALEQVLSSNRENIKEYVDLRVEGVVFIK